MHVNRARGVLSLQPLSGRLYADPAERIFTDLRSDGFGVECLKAMERCLGDQSSSIYVTFDRPVIGRSYEMSLILACLGITGMMFTGEVLRSTDDFIYFGPSGAQDIKRRAYPSLLTSVDVPYVCLG